MRRSSSPVRARRAAAGGRAAALALLLASATPPGALAATIVVTTTADPAPLGQCGLRDAITASNTDAPAGGCPAGSGADVIDLTGLTGTIHVGSGVPPAELPFLTGEVELRGPGPDRLAVSGDGQVRVFFPQAFGSGVAIEGLTIRDGNSATSTFDGGLGGCVYALGPLAIRNARLTGCAASALYVGMSATRLERVLVDANPGAGILVGGITGSGGIGMENVTVTGNGSFGLALVNADGPGPNATVVHSTFVENGGANVFVPIFSGDPDEFPLRLSHVLLASGEPNVNCGGEPVISLGANIANDGTCALDAEDDLPATPVSLGPLADNGGPTRTHAPFFYSEAVDTGAATCPGLDGPLATDQRGRPRPRDGNGDGTTRCDRGAVELPEPAGGALAAALALAALRVGRRERRAGALGALAAGVLAVAPAAAQPLSNTPLYGTALVERFPTEPGVWAEREGYDDLGDFAVQTRVRRGAPGSPAAGLYLYEYRLFRTTLFDALTGWTAPLRGLAPHDLDGDGEDDTSAWCADCPPPATGPFASERDGDVVTFSFFNGVEAASAPLYLVSAHPPVPGEGVFETSRGPIPTVSLVGAAGTATNTPATAAHVLAHFAINGPGLVAIVDGNAGGVHVNTRVWAGRAATAAEGLYLYDYWIETGAPPATGLEAFTVPAAIASFDLDGDGVPDTASYCSDCTGGATPPARADEHGDEVSFAFASGIPGFSANLYLLSTRPPRQTQGRVRFPGGAEATLTALPEPGVSGGAAALAALAALRARRRYSGRSARV